MNIKLECLRLLTVRRYKQLNQDEFASILDKSVKAYSLYETGKLSMSGIAVELIRMGFSFDWIISGRGSMLINQRNQEPAYREEIFNLLTEINMKLDKK